MVLAFSNMFPLGAKAPGFRLSNVVNDEMVSLEESKSEIASVLMFICNHCPYVKHINHEIAQLTDEYLKKGISFLAISSNDADTFPDDNPEMLKAQAKEFGFNFPYLYDERQLVAKAYKAACTPDFFIFDKNLECVYRGQLDDSRHKNDIPVTGSDLRNALDSLLKGEPVSSEQKPSSGCNIKWKEGVSPFL